MNSYINKVVLISRFFQEDEEMHILTHSDELNRTYGEENILPFDNIADRNSTSSGENRGNSPSETEQDNPSMRDRPAPNLMGSTGTSRQEGPAFKVTRATVISSGPSTITITSAVSTADSLWFTNTTSFNKGRRSSQLQTDNMGSNSENNPSFIQNQDNKRTSYQLAGLKGDSRSFCEDGGEKGKGEDTVEGTSQLCMNLEERAATSLGNLIQSPSTDITDLNPTSTITAWEAGWNVTNAIQVHLCCTAHTHEQKPFPYIRKEKTTLECRCCNFVF